MGTNRGQRFLLEAYPSSESHAHMYYDRKRNWTHLLSGAQINLAALFFFFLLDLNRDVRVGIKRGRGRNKTDTFRWLCYIAYCLLVLESSCNNGGARTLSHLSWLLRLNRRCLPPPGPLLYYNCRIFSRESLHVL